MHNALHCSAGTEYGVVLDNIVATFRIYAGQPRFMYEKYTNHATQTLLKRE